MLAGALRSIVGRLTDRGDHPRPGRVRLGRRGGGRALDDQPGPGARHVPAPGHPGRGLYLQDLGRPEAARVLKDAAIAEARARQQAEQERLLAEEAIAEAQPQPRPQAGRDPGRDRRGQGPVGRGRTAGRGRAPAAHPGRAAEGGRAQRRAQAAPARHRGAQAGRRRALPGRAGGRGAQERRRSPTPTPGARPPSPPRRPSAEQSRLTGEGERARRAALAEAVEREGAAEARGDPGQGQRRGGGDAEQGRRRSPPTARRPCSTCCCGCCPQVVEAAARAGRARSTR